jgi:hypothetical protein
MNGRSMLLLLLLLLAVGAGACASSRGVPQYRQEIGSASGPDAMILAEQVLGRHGFHIEQADTTPEIRILTRWRQRAPLEDERALGVTGAENRVLIVGRIRGQASDLGALHIITMTIDNRVQMAGSPEWVETLNTDMFREYAAEIVNDYRQLVLNIGVRRF